MNNEILKRDLCARLMDGVKAEIKGKTGCVYLALKQSSDVLYGIKCDLTGNFYECNNPKPILFPTSALTKPIQIANYNNGEPFVPLDIFKKKANELKSTSEDYMFDFNCVNNYIGLSRGSYDNFEGIDIFDEEHKCVNTPFWIIELLNQWHINYRLSPEQFIEVTDSFNPYK